MSPSVWATLCLEEVNQMGPVAQAGWLASLGVRVGYSLPDPSPAKCTQCALVFDQLSEVWGQGLALPRECFQRKSRNWTWKSRWGVITGSFLMLLCDSEYRCFLVGL